MQQKALLRVSGNFLGQDFQFILDWANIPVFQISGSVVRCGQEHSEEISLREERHICWLISCCGPLCSHNYWGLCLKYHRFASLVARENRGRYVRWSDGKEIHKVCRWEIDVMCRVSNEDEVHHFFLLSLPWGELHLNISAAVTKVYHQHLYLSFSLQLLLTDFPNLSFNSFPVHSISGSQSDLPKLTYIFYHVTSRFESLQGMSTAFRMRPGLLSRSFITLNILICAIHYAGDQPPVVMEHSKCGQSYLRYAICVKYTP